MPANVEWQRPGVATKVGTRADIFGLASRISLGGSHKPRALPVAQSDNPEDSPDISLRPSTIATVDGLTGRVDLNGTKVELLTFKEKQQRWAVLVPQSGERVLVRPENLIPGRDELVPCEAAADDFTVDADPPEYDELDVDSAFDVEESEAVSGIASMYIRT